MKVVGIIPARYASSRFPGKPLIDLKGKTMIQRVVEGAKKCNLLSDVIVATDDQRIFDHVKAFGGSVAMTASHHPSGTDRCGELAKHLDADVIINIQGDEPLIDSRQLEQVINAFHDPAVHIATLGIDMESLEDLSNPNRIKIVTNAQGNAMYFSRSEIPNSYHFKPVNDERFPYLRHIGLYAYRRETLLELIALTPTLIERVESLEQLRWLYHGYTINVVNTTIETPNIDVPEDVEKVIALL